MVLAAAARSRPAPHTCLPTVLRRVHGRHPDLDLQVHEEQTSSLLEGLAAGRLDLLLLAVPLGVPGVTEIPLFDEDFVLVMEQEHWLGGRSNIPRDALRELPLLLLDEGHCLRDQALDICREASHTPGAPVTTTAAGLSTLVQLVAGGLGVTLLPRTAVTVETGHNKALATGYFADPAPTRRVALAMQTGSARGGGFVELAAALREAMKPLPVRPVGARDAASSKAVPVTGAAYAYGRGPGHRGTHAYGRGPVPGAPAASGSGGCCSVRRPSGRIQRHSGSTTPGSPRRSARPRRGPSARTATSRPPSAICRRRRPAECGAPVPKATSTDSSRLRSRNCSSWGPASRRPAPHHRSPDLEAGRTRRGRRRRRSATYGSSPRGRRRPRTGMPSPRSRRTAAPREGGAGRGGAGAPVVPGLSSRIMRSTPDCGPGRRAR
ncbi:hypothetical protein SCALM49S_05753 [Streptomyces californicus]